MTLAADRPVARRAVPPGRRRLDGHALAPVVLGAIAVIGVLAVTVSWWRSSTGPSTELGPQLSAVGRLFGLYAALSASGAMLLMARIPWLDRMIGTDKLARIHATVGRAVVGGAALHVTFIVWGYAEIAGVGPWSQVRTLWSSYPHMVRASVAFGLLILIGGTSARLARSRLPYETWHLLHLATYAAIFLMFAHTLSSGMDFVGHPTTQLLWKSWFVLVFALAAVFRFVLPLSRSVGQAARVSAVESENAITVSIRITGRHGYDAQAGQFVRVRFLSRGRWWQSHPFSLSEVPDGQSLRITVKGCGDFTRTVAGVDVGSRVLVTGPYGGLTPSRRRGRKVLLVAGGVGITPMRTLFEVLPADGNRLVLLYRANSCEDLVLRDELDELAARRGGTVHYLPGPYLGFDDPLSGSNLAELVPDIAERDVFLCGPPAMMATVTDEVVDLGVPRDRIHAERFSL